MFLQAIVTTYILFSPFIASLIFFFFGKYLGIKGSYRITMFTSFFQVLMLFFYYKLFSSYGNFFYLINYGNWFSVAQLQVFWEFVIDGLSYSMGSLVILISIVTQFYSYWYLSNEPNIIRFQGYLQLFTFSMLLLVFSNNFIIFFLGWEGVGLCSFLLIGFWSTRVEARSAALKAVFVNRFGDMTFLGAIGIIYKLTNSVDFSTVFIILPYYSYSTINFIGWNFNILVLLNSLFVISIMAKSAQIGLHIWLADAMEGPTPVSALIHAATMVTAGIYLVLRCHSIFILTPQVEEAMAIIGASTAFFGAFTACFQWDIKKIIAYSTCSQLGYMLCACGFEAFNIGFHHLIVHGFFKALLFLASGLLIHLLNGEQDIRRMGALRKIFPLTFSYFFVGFTALVGFPGTSGFFSKERILDYISIYESQSNFICYNLLWFALICTAFYSIKVFYFVFFGEYRGSNYFWKIKFHKVDKETEISFVLQSLLTILVFCIVVTESFYYNFTSSSEESIIFNVLPKKNIEFFSETLASSNRLYPFIGIIFGFLIFYFINFKIFSILIMRKNFKINKLGTTFQIIKFFQKACFFDIVFHHLFFKFFNFIVKQSFIFEKGICEWIGPSGCRYMIERFYSYMDLSNVRRSIFNLLGILFLTIFFFLIWNFV